MTKTEDKKLKKKFKLIDEIKSNPLYKKRGKMRARYAHQEIIENTTIHKGKLVPGQLALFQYYEPKTKEDLEYYDAWPCTIFFGRFKSKNGWREIGFNIHYYPPRMRYSIMNKIFNIYKPIYLKYFEDPLKKEIDAFDYEYLMSELKRRKLDFGIRMYIPNLRSHTRIIPPKYFSTSVFTEGLFKKETRAQIMSYWKKKGS